jgi:hypothetical protein
VKVCIGLYGLVLVCERLVNGGKQLVNGLYGFVNGGRGAMRVGEPRVDACGRQRSREREEATADEHGSTRMGKGLRLRLGFTIRNKSGECRSADFRISRNTGRVGRMIKMFDSHVFSFWV